MSQIRVLQLNPELGRGGAERVMLYLAQEMNRSRFEVRTLSLYDAVDPALQDLVDRADFQTYFLGKRPGPDLRAVRAIGRVLRAYRPHVVHTHSYVLRYALPSMLRHRPPVMLHTVHNLAHKESQKRVGRLGRWIHAYAFRRGVIPVAIADEVHRSLCKVYGERDYPLVPNGIPVDRYQHPAVSRADWRAREGFAGEDVLFLNVGRLQEQKNIPLLLEAFAAGPAGCDRAHLLLAGAGPLRDDLEARARELNLTGRVRFLGMRPDIPDVLNAADVFVLSSDWEGNPLAVMEAMAAGKPFVGTRVGGVPELVEDGAMGILLDKGDREGLTRGMMTLLEAPERRQAMGQEAARRARERFDMKVMVRQYEALYERLLRRQGVIPEVSP